MKKKIGIAVLVLLGLALLYLKIFGLPQKKDDDMELVASGGSTGVKPIEATVEERKPAHTDEGTEVVTGIEEIDITENIPEYSGNSYCELDNNVPHFDERSTESYIHLSELDSLGRVQAAEACLSLDTMPKDGEERGEIGSIRPSGWNQAKYEGVINSEPPYVYNRCHVLMWALTGLNAEPRNLVTGTRYMNIEMTAHELMVVRYIENTGNHVMYRVTPVYVEDELVCRGLEMEALSVEDEGLGISYHVFYWNVQPGIGIDYSTGETHYTGEFFDSDSETVILPGTDKSTEN